MPFISRSLRLPGPPCRRILTALVSLVCLTAAAASAQSQAANGAIEGIVTDASGGLLPGVVVTLTNLDNGTERSLVTNAAGLFRGLLLPLGTYRVAAELPGFKKFEQSGVAVGVGATATVNISLSVGEVSETITVSASEMPALDLARIDIGHTISDVEVHSLPLVARNPYNFALVQPGVTGYENSEFGVPRLSSNGQAMRVNYQIDGNTNTQKDRAGLRLLPMSEVMIEQVKVVTTGFAPEFGQALGMVYNAVTPSGTNVVRGQGSYLFRRDPFSAFPFFFGCGSTTPARDCPERTAGARRPGTRVDTGTASVGGPILQNRMFFYGGWERTRRDLSSANLITVSPDLVSQLGLRPQPPAAPNTQTANFAIGKVDYQVNRANRLTARYLRFVNDAPYNAGTTGGALLERQTDFLDGMYSAAAQLVTTLGATRLNEFRVQVARRRQQSVANADSGTGPAITISSPAVAFGGPYAVIGQNAAGFDFTQRITQVVDNFTLVRASHSYKLGIDWQLVADERVAAPQFHYTFPNAAAYLAARDGAAPFGYTSVVQISGDRRFEMRTAQFSFFAQDDWQLTRTIKLLYGVRYDRYGTPDPLADAPLPQSRAFAIDGNNFGPRVGIAWAVTPTSVVRASSGLMFDQPILGGYEQALQFSGAPRAPAYTFTGTASPRGMSDGAPAFPNPTPVGTISQQSPWTIARDFAIARTWQTTLQYERAIGADFTAAVSATYARGRHLPVVTDINLINPVGALPDGRPIYGPAGPATRLDPRFNQIFEVQSIGESTYSSVTLQASRRWQAGLTFNAQYTWGRAIDNAPLLTQMTVQSENGRSDPTNLDRDRGPNPLDLRHNFTGSLVFISSSRAERTFVRALLGGHELGVLFTVNSGLPATFFSNLDLNGDGVSPNNDRPAFVGRNSLYMPSRQSVDVRYTRTIPVSGSLRGEVIAELKNAFNIRQLQQVNTVVATDAQGIPLAPLPTDAYALPNPQNPQFEQRKFQLGFRVRF